MVDELLKQVKSVMASMEHSVICFGRFVAVRQAIESMDVEDFPLHAHAFQTEPPVIVCLSIRKTMIPYIPSGVIVATNIGWYEYTLPITEELLTNVFERAMMYNVESLKWVEFCRANIQDKKKILVAGNPDALTEADPNFNEPYFYPRKMVVKQLKNTARGILPPFFDRALMVYFMDNDVISLAYPRNDQAIDENIAYISDYFWDSFWEYWAFKQPNKHFHKFQIDQNVNRVL